MAKPKCNIKPAAHILWALHTLYKAKLLRRGKGGIWYVHDVWSWVNRS